MSASPLHRFVLSERALGTIVTVLSSCFLKCLLGHYKELTLLLCFLTQLKYKEVYQRNKSNCTIVPDAVHIKAAKDAYKVNTNVSSRNISKPSRGFVSFFRTATSLYMASSDWALMSPDQELGWPWIMNDAESKCCLWFSHRRRMGNSKRGLTLCH